jgi:hypothetical protein
MDSRAVALLAGALVQVGVDEDSEAGRLRVLLAGGEGFSSPARGDQSPQDGAAVIGAVPRRACRRPGRLARSHRANPTTATSSSLILISVIRTCLVGLRRSSDRNRVLVETCPVHRSWRRPPARDCASSSSGRASPSPSLSSSRRDLPLRGRIQSASRDAAAPRCRTQPGTGRQAVAGQSGHGDVLSRFCVRGQLSMMF